MSDIVTIKNAALKNDKNLVKIALETIKKEGFWVFLKRFYVFISLALKRFFREYLVLKWLSFFSNNGEIIKTVQGSKMVLDLKDIGISRELALYGVHEKNSTAELKRLIKPGMKIVEAGANVGYYTLIESRMVGDSGYIYAFEPSPYNIAKLKRNIEINNIKNAEMIPKAVGANNGVEKFYISSKSNLSSFIDRKDVNKILYEDKGGKVIDVDVVRLDDFLKDKKVDYIRMDVEGFEKEILEGLRETLKNDPPKYMFIEIHCDLLHERNSFGREILMFMKGFGYEVRKSFYRGHDYPVVSSMDELLNHPDLEKGYWETFFVLN
jgi:FkbM family methyltransferase